MKKILLFLLICLSTFSGFTQSVNMQLPALKLAKFNLLGDINGHLLLLLGMFVIIATFGFCINMFRSVKKKKAHISLKKKGKIIWSNCKTYLKEQAKLIFVILFSTFAFLLIYLWKVESEYSKFEVILSVLSFSLLGVTATYGIAIFGMRVNTLASPRSCFSAIQKKRYETINICLKSGMANGLFLISLELVIMVSMLLFLPSKIGLLCLLGFSIGESLGASVLRLVGGIFTKIADIGADLMKLVFKIEEDDPRNPAVIADCVGDNAGDSTGPTADAFETYGVTGVALITFIVLAVPDSILAAKLIVWIFFMRYLMDVSSAISFYINDFISRIKYKNKEDFDFEEPLSRLIRIAAFNAISLSFILSYFLMGDVPGQIWWKLATIINIGVTIPLIMPEITKIFVSTKSNFVRQTVVRSRDGGAPLNILSGLVIGFISAYWQTTIVVLLGLFACVIGALPGMEPIAYSSIFTLGLMTFGMLSMGPVSIAVDSFGPIADNAQSVLSLSQIEKIPGIKEEIERDYGFTPDFEIGKEILEKNDGCGNTFKATIKPTLIQTAVVGVLAIVFATILLLDSVNMLNVSLTNPVVIFGVLYGGAYIYFFSGGGFEAVVSGARNAVNYTKENLDLDVTEADEKKSNKVTMICTKFAQKGGLNLIGATISTVISLAFFDPNFFVAFIIGLALFGILQATSMANAGGAWDNAKKIVEVELKEKGTSLHDATIVGDTVGDPHKDTVSVSINPLIKFASLFGLIAVETAIFFADFKDGVASYTSTHKAIALIFFLISLFFIKRSFSGISRKTKEI